LSHPRRFLPGTAAAPRWSTACAAPTTGKFFGAGVIDIKHPQAVRYEPTSDGKMMLIAVEYMTPTGPAWMEGQLFNFIGAPNRYGLGPFYGLHVCAWKANPRGVFADMNPNVTCEHSSSEHH
jgi:hypothetical protein